MMKIEFFKIYSKKRKKNCKIFKHFFLLLLGDQRLIGHKKNDHGNLKDLSKSEVETVLAYILWPQSQRLISKKKNLVYIM